MTEKMLKACNIKEIFGTTRADKLQDFNCISYDLFIASLNAFDFDRSYDDLLDECKR